jgi:Tetratricopeptide repeat
LAKVLVATGSPEDALKFGAAALAAHEAALGPAHPWTADSAGVMAQALQAIGRTGEAVELRRRYGLEQPSLNRSAG